MKSLLVILLLSTGCSKRLEIPQSNAPLSVPSQNIVIDQYALVTFDHNYAHYPIVNLVFRDSEDKWRFVPRPWTNISEQKNCPPYTGISSAGKGGYIGGGEADMADWIVRWPRVQEWLDTIGAYRDRAQIADSLSRTLYPLGLHSIPKTFKIPE